MKDECNYHEKKERQIKWEDGKTRNGRGKVWFRTQSGEENVSFPQNGLVNKNGPAAATINLRQYFKSSRGGARGMKGSAASLMKSQM
ncbi:hypothetical protein Pmani_028349 [Petrolisthes manimaculis]|uniref:Uncharacterized protein n=1 Tax=Petrolisthes manimaculis TaxID=1843537 RepID=A0AAE1P2E3_9EUCA|nr:hypothetical protein Pmani_028349 [Petrolisthes manimaculis]